MLWTLIHRAFRKWWIAWTDDGSMVPADPIDHPSLRSMSPRELADLPIDPRRRLGPPRRASGP